MSEKFGCAVRELETGVQLTSSIHLPDTGCFSCSLQLYKLPLHPVWVLKHWVAMAFSHSIGEMGQPCSGTSPTFQLRDYWPLSLCIPHVLSLFMTWSKKSQWVRSSNGGELVELCSALWVLILGVSHVSEMVRESKCVSHLQINQICHMNAYLRSWWEDTV